MIHKNIEFLHIPPLEHSEVKYNERFREMIIRLGVDVEKFIFDVEVINRDAGNERVFDKTVDYYRNLPVDSLTNLYFDDELIIFVYGYYSKEGLSQISKDYWDLYPICSREEIERIDRPSHLRDLLLTIRVFGIISNVRVRRFFVGQFTKSDNWTLTGYYDDSHFSRYLASLPESMRDACKGVVGGFAYLVNANAACIRTDMGCIIVVSELLKKFLYYMNLFMVADDDCGINRMAAYLIAVRIMRGYESMDFDLDSRGNVPEEIHNYVCGLVDEQIEFVIGHEFAHHLLGHLEQKNGADLDLLNILSGRETHITGQFNFKSNQEFAADTYCVNRASYSDEKKNAIVNAGFRLFMTLAYSSIVDDYMAPPIHWRSSHPAPIDRIWHLRKSVSRKFGFSVKSLKKWEKEFLSIKKELEEDFLPFNIDIIEMHGSIYLQAREGKPMFDRVDY